MDDQTAKRMKMLCLGRSYGTWEKVSYGCKGLFAIDPFCLLILFSNARWHSDTYSGEYFVSKLDIFMLAHSLFNELNKGSNPLGIVS